MWLQLRSARLLLTVIAIAIPSIAAPQSAGDIAGRVVEVEISAPSLAGNLLGTPETQGAAVYLPPSYDREPGRRYPVVYLLHGVFDDYGVWLENYEVPATLDHLISTGEIPEFLAVMPNGGNQYGGGYYRNSPVSGRWGDYIAEDLVGFVDAEFRTLPRADSRAVVGHSMGGYGALHLAMSHPGLFSVVWAMSPCCLMATDDFGFGNDAWKRAASVSSSDDLQALVDSGDFLPIALLGVVTAFSPDPDDPPIHADFPFSIVRGEVVLEDTPYDRFLDELPIRQVEGAREALRDLRGIAIGVGLGDQFLHIPKGSLAFSQRLGAERIPHRLDVHEGDHRQLVRERLESTIFPWVGERLVLAE